MADVIELIWKLEKESVSDLKSIGAKLGIYQIYGTHPIYGRNVLLYIGVSTTNIFKRIKSHKSNWVKFEYDPVIIYFGEIVTPEEDFDFSMAEAIAMAESLLVYYCAPAYNSNLIVEIKEQYLKQDLIIRNYGKIGSLPTEVSTGWYKSDVWKQAHFEE
jgi:hypothetical protein